MLLIGTVYGQVINSTDVSEEDVLCPGKQVILTCETRTRVSLPLTLRWRSEQYIGMGGAQLTFSTANPVNATERSTANPNTIATLIENTIEDDERVLVSELRIITSAGFPRETITCMDEDGMDNDGRDTFTLHMLGM